MRIRIDSRPSFWVGDLKRYADRIAKFHLNPMGVQCEFSDSGNKNHIVIMLDEGKSANLNTRGVEILYNPKKPVNERLAKYLLDGICSSTRFMNRGIRAEDIAWDVHVTCGYITNVSDRAFLKDEARKRGIVWGIMESLKECLKREPHSKRQNFIPA